MSHRSGKLSANTAIGDMATAAKATTTTLHNAPGIQLVKVVVNLIAERIDVNQERLGVIFFLNFFGEPCNGGRIGGMGPCFNMF